MRVAGAEVHRVVGSATHPDDIPLGPDHPTLDGLPTIHLQHDGEVILSAEWIAGTVHRGAEKLFESRDYRQIVMLVDRHDWLSAFCSEIGVVVGIERALGLTPPPRAQHLRILLCELTRIAHHLAFLAPLPGDLPPWWRQRAWAWRAEVLELIEAATGQRVHPMFAQVGGVRADVAAGWVARVAAAATRWSGVERDRRRARDRQPSLERLATWMAARPGTAADRSPGWPVWTAPSSARSSIPGTPALRSSPPRQAQGFGASGPVARASGVDLDLRRDDPYLPYPPFDVPTSGAGDARARIRMLVEELDPEHRAGRVGLGPPRRRVGRTRLRPAAEGRPGPGGGQLHVDREPDRDQRVPAGVAQRPDALAAEAAQRGLRQCRRAGRRPGRDQVAGPSGGCRELPDRLRGRRSLRPRAGPAQRTSISAPDARAGRWRTPRRTAAGGRRRRSG